MKPCDVNNLMLKPALSLLPPKMDSMSARVVMLAIGYQESKFDHRVQVRGPARGYWQFEEIGVREVMRNPASKVYAETVLARLDLADAPEEIHTCIRWSGLVAAVVARLYLWTDPYALPGPDDEAGMAQLYQRVWRPGKYRAVDWPTSFAYAVDAA